MNAEDVTDTIKQAGSDADAAVTEAEVEPRATSADSTLIEFPGTHTIPHWRIELSERVRAIQHRKAQEAALRGEKSASDAMQGVKNKEHGAGHAHLGIVSSSPATQKLNPVVAAALARIERVHQRHTTTPQQTVATSASASHEVVQTSAISESTLRLCASVQTSSATLAAPEAMQPDGVTAPAEQSPIVDVGISVFSSIKKSH